MEKYLSIHASPSVCALRLSYSIFLADLLAWVAQQHNVSFLIQYLDDFLTMGPPSSQTCQQNLDTLIRICNYFGVPLALKKIEGPSTAISFLGIILDTTAMEARLPEKKNLKS